jgi:hypothetical protein
VALRFFFVFSLTPAKKWLIKKLTMILDSWHLSMTDGTLFWERGGDKILP